MTATIVRGDARRLPLPDASVDLIVTSPPYFNLRSYTDTPELCARCRELTGQGWEYPRASDEARDLRQAWPDWDAHVKAEHKAAHYGGQIGAEATPQAYIASLIECTREWMRVLKPTGSIFVNLGDKYSTGASGQNGTGKTGLYGGKAAPGTRPAGRHDRMAGRTGAVAGLPPKSLLLLPERYRIACVDELGLIARAVLIWDKPNGLPESVTDRVRRSHEDWVHLTKQPRYFAAVDAIRETYSDRVQDRQRYAGRDIAPSKGYAPDNRNDADRAKGILGFGHAGVSPLGKLPGSVWTIATQPLKVPAHLGVDHFAAYPMEWPRRIIQGWSPSGICTACGEGRRPATERGPRVDRRPSQHREYPAHHAGHETRTLDVVPDYRITGEVCACTPYTDHPDRRRALVDAWQERGDGTGNRIRPSGRNNNADAAERAARRAEVGPVREYHFDRWTPAPTRPAVVVDPFGGTGTTALVAHALGRHGISFDYSGDYCRLARWRTTDPGQLAAALQVEKPAVQHEGQMDLFGVVA